VWVAFRVEELFLWSAFGCFSFFAPFLFSPEAVNGFLSVFLFSASFVVFFGFVQYVSGIFGVVLLFLGLVFCCFLGLRF